VLLIQSGPLSQIKLWRDAFASLTPGLRVAHWDEPFDPGAVRYVIAWQPTPGRLATFPNLRLIVASGAGVDGVLADPMRPRHVPLVRTITLEAVTKMVEFAVLAVLAHHRAWSTFADWRQERRFEYLDCPPAQEREVGVMGLGELGEPVTRALAHLGFRTSGWSRRRRQIEGVTCYAGAAERAAFLARSAILVNLLPLDPATTGVLRRSLFERLPRGAFIVNLGRGGHLVEEDLIPALDDGLLAGATLDVFRHEPLPPGHPFWSDRRITITPHVASLARVETRARAAAAAIAALEEGRPLPHVWAEEPRGES